MKGINSKNIVNIPIFDDNIKNIKDKFVQGRVKLYKNNKLIEDTTNLVVYMGRKFAAQNTFKTANGADVDFTSYSITHFAIGNGGTETDNLTSVVGPEDTDTTLYKAISLNTSDTTNYLPLEDKTGTVVSGALKKITLDGSIEFVKDTTTNDYTTVKCKLVIDPTSHDISLPDTFLVSEAGLFFTDSGKSVKGMFAHVCFPGKYLTKNDILTIEWYFLF